MQRTITKSGILLGVIFGAALQGSPLGKTAYMHPGIHINSGVAAFTNLYFDIISGKVVNEKGEPVQGATITEKNTGATTLTDKDGNFSIDVPAGAVLTISRAGYAGQEIPANGSQLSITLSSNGDRVRDISEVVMTGYTSQKKSNITGAVSTVDMKDLSKTHMGDAAQALQGQVAGVVISANTGAPGDGIQVRVRGETTFGASNDALYVIDGVPTRDISFLNPSDIQSMTVLKDAAATAIYGSRSAGGVVVITTKAGVKGRASIDLDYFSGYNFAANMPKMLNADQYLTVKDIAWHNTYGNAADAISPYAALKASGSINGIKMADTDWLKALFNAGTTNNFQISANGGSETIQYLLSGGLLDQDGIIVGNNDTYKRFNFRSNINVNLSNRIRIGTNMQLSDATQDKLSSSGDAPGVIRHALIRPPVLPIYKTPNDPTYTPGDPYTDLPFYTGPNNGWSPYFEYSSNPLAIVNFTNDKRNTFQIFGNVFGEYSLLNDKALKFKSNLGVDISFTHNKAFAQNYGDSQIADPTNIYYGMGRNNLPNSLNENRGQTMAFTWSNTLNYIKTFNEVHAVNFLLGSEFITSKSSAIGGSRANFQNSSPDFQYLDYGNTALNVWSSGSASSWTLLSYFASGSYAFRNKYLLSGTIRADASSRFGPNNRWGYFPSASAGWVISKENFLKDVQWLSNLKLRASYGKSGNQEIPDFQWYNLYSLGTNPQLTRIGNPDIRWETTTQKDAGIDLSILRNRLSFSADYFNKDTNGILLPVTPPGLVGSFSPTDINSGAVSNKGFEFALNVCNNPDRNFKYNINANLSTLKNRVDALYTYVTSLIDNTTHTITVVGSPISSYYGYKFDGIYQNTAQIIAQLGSYSPSSGPQPGDIRFKDLNGDGKIDANDRTIIGSPIPKYTYGFNFSCQYKNFDFSFMIQGVQGVQRYNDLKQILNYDSRPFNSTTAVLGAWNGEGSSNTTPRLTFNDNGGSRVSDIFVEDASYTRLKNVEIGYTVTTAALKGVRNLRFYLSGQNLLTWTKYTGLDPESTSLIDQGTYPQSRAFIFGIKAKF